MFGHAVFKTVCRGQALIALTSAESDFYCLTTAASESLSERSFAMEVLGETSQAGCCRCRQTPRLVWPSALARALVE